MKRLLGIALILACAAPVWAQNQPTIINRTFNLSVATPIGPNPPAAPISERGTGISSHIINWTIVGTVSTCSVKVQKSIDGVTWADLIAGATCTSNGTSTLTTDYANYVRVNATTISGSGTLVVNYFGFPPAQTLTATVDTTGLATSANQTNATQKTQLCDAGDVCVDVTTGAAHVIVDSGGGGGSTAQGAAIAGVTGGLSLTSTTTAAPTYVDQTANPINTDLAGNVRVNLATALPAGTNGIGKLTANSGVDIGDVNAPALELAQNSTTSGQVGPLTQCATTTAAPVYTTLKTNPCSTDTSGNIRVAGPADVYNATLPTYMDQDAVTAFEYTSRGALLTSGLLIGNGTLASGAVTSAMTGTTTTSVIGATASNYIYVTQCTASNASTTVSTDILLQDGSGGTTLYVLPAPAAAVATTGGGGGTFTFPVPLKVTTAGNALFAANVTTGSSTKISCSGFKSTVSY